MKERFLAAIGPVLGIGLFGLAIAILHHELAAYHYRDVMAHLAAIPRSGVVLAFALTAAGYVSLTGYDTLAFRWIGHPLRYSRIALASFVAYVFSHNIGLSFFGGSAVRYRMFTSWGITPAELARIIPFNVITFWLGFFTLAGSVLVLQPVRLPGAWLPLLETSRPLGVLFLAVLALYVAQSLRRGRSLSVRGFELTLPGIGFTAAQMGLSTIDWTLAAGVLWALLPSAPGLGFTDLLGAFLLAQVAGVVSHVPAGLGVFETMLVLLLAPWLPGDVVLGSALAYRLVYYVLPLVVAVALFAAFELRQRREALRRAAEAASQWAPELVPRVFAVTTFAAGVVLLLSGATPGVGGRIELIDRLLPLPVLEVSHFLASLVGVALLLLSRAIQQRVDAAYVLTLAMLGAGAVFSLLKGF